MPQKAQANLQTLTAASSGCIECGRPTTRICKVCNRPLYGSCGRIERECAKCFVKIAEEVEA